MDGKEFEREVEERFQEGKTLLLPFTVKRLLPQSEREQTGDKTRIADFEMDLSIHEEAETFRFLVECKAGNTPRMIQTALQQAQSYVGPDEFPLVIVPYLSSKHLDYLEADGGSGVDLCGNGIVVVPRRVYVKRWGQPNLYPTSRPLQNPYKGRSAMVARILLEQFKWDSVRELRSALADADAQLSAPQVSKALAALQDELIVIRSNSQIVLSEPLRLLDNLGQQWKTPDFRRRQLLRLDAKETAMERLINTDIRWAVMGESSVSRYATFAQGAPWRIAVSDLAIAREVLQGQSESVRNFADVELCETDEVGFYFDNEVDAQGVRFASRLQTWLELQNGDARQKDVAQELQAQIIRRLSDAK